jgi:hypothetical protein
MIKIIKEILLVIIAIVVAYVISLSWILHDFTVGRNKEWEK